MEFYAWRMEGRKEEKTIIFVKKKRNGVLEMHMTVMGKEQREDIKFEPSVGCCGICQLAFIFESFQLFLGFSSFAFTATR